VIKEKIRDELILLIVKVCDKDLQMDDFKVGIKLIDDLEFDSITIMELIVEIEEHFAINFDDEEELIDIVNDFDELVKYIKAFA
jgi:acyl carrier protein